MNVILLVIDGLGVWRDDGEDSTYQNVILHMGSESDEKFPNLYRLGLHIATKGKGNIMLQSSSSVGSLEGHREMMGYVTDENWKVLDNGVPTNILKELQSEEDIRFVGNIQGRGKDVIPKYWKIHREVGSPIIYSGFDSTVCFGVQEGIVSKHILIHCAESLHKKLQKTGLQVRKIIVRIYDTDAKIIGSQIEVYSKANIDFESYGFTSWFVNSKIDDILRYNKSNVTETQNDSDSIEYVLKTHEKVDDSFFFFNLGDFDRYAHMGSYLSCYNALLNIDGKIGELMNSLREDEMLIISSDHGISFSKSDLSTAHLKEYTLLLLSIGGHPLICGRKTIDHTVISKILMNRNNRQMISTIVC